jgi:hypothetical protein
MNRLTYELIAGGCLLSRRTGLDCIADSVSPETRFYFFIKQHKDDEIIAPSTPAVGQLLRLLSIAALFAEFGGELAVQVHEEIFRQRCIFIATRQSIYGHRE